MKPEGNDGAIEKGKNILRQMREEIRTAKHLDQQKLRAQAAIKRALDAGDEEAFVAALTALGIDPESEAGKAHLRGFRQLRGRSY